MPIVLVLDQRASSSSPDRVPATARRLNADLAPALELPIARTAGDEMQALVLEAEAVLATALHVVQDRGWWLGIGIGDVERPLGDTAPESRGPAFVAARAAIEASKKKRRSPRGLAVAGAEGDAEAQRVAEDLDAGLNALAYILDGRTARQHEAVRLAERGLRGVEIAAELGVTQQTVSQVLRDAGFEEQRRLMGLVTRIADRALA
jgi:hypothetical protein